MPKTVSTKLNAQMDLLFVLFEHKMKDSQHLQKDEFKSASNVDY